MGGLPGAKPFLGLLAGLEREGAKLPSGAQRRGAVVCRLLLAVANRHKVRAELVEYQHRTGFMLADMVSLMLGLDDSMSEDRSEKGIDDVQFYAAMTRRFGYRGTPWVLSSVFRSIDAE